MKESKLLKFLLKLVVSLALVVWLVLKIDWKQFWELLQGVSVWGIVIFVIVYVASVLFSAIKWKYIAADAGFEMSVWQSFQRYLAGSFINTFLPSTIGGDTYRTLALAGKDGSKKDSLATVVMDRVSGLVITVLFAVAFGLANEAVKKNDLFMSILLIMTAGLICFVFFMIFSKSLLARKLAGHFPQKVKLLLEVLKKFNNIQAISSMSFWTALYVIAGPCLTNYITFWVLHIHVSASDFLAVVFMASVIITLPISVGNLGLKEWTYITFFGIFGISAPQAAAAVILGRFLMMLVNATALPMYLKEKKN